MSYLLGVNCSGFHSSACLLTREGIHTAICEERLSRVKQDRRFPLAAIEYCLGAAGLDIHDVDHVFIGWHPRFYLQMSDRTLQDAFRNRGKLAYLALNELATLSRREITDVAERLFHGKRELEIRFVDHHQAHLDNAFFQSGFERADFLMLDGFGEMASGSCGSVARDRVDPQATFRTPHSLGSFYSAFTDFLGFRPNQDEWKVMALAALGDPERDYERVRRLVRVDGLHLELDLSYFEHFLFFTPRHFSPKFVAEFGAPLEPGAEPEPRHADLVAAVQRVSEEAVFALLRTLAARAGNDQLVLGGGYFMNSVCNGKLVDQTPYREVFVGGSPDDSGVALGSALHGAHRRLGWEPARTRARHNYFGRTYDGAEVLQELERRKIRHRRLDDPTETAAQLLRQGKIVGWFQGAAEFGQRALGNRSILADPTLASMKDTVNRSVKYREHFRPFAPSVLKERQGELFSGLDEGGGYFMEKVFPFKPEWSGRLPAVSHFDGTGRLHTVDADVNPLFYRLICEFEKLSGAPVVLNTSFNTSGMPLVETPGDALDCFYSSGIDALVLGDRLVEK